MKFIVLIFSFLFNLCAVGQLNTTVEWRPKSAPSKSDTIFYNYEKKLVWDNFNVRNTEPGGAAALTTAGFGFGAGLNSRNGKGVFSINVFCYFLKSRSWYKEKYRNSYVLTHEQHHFDIAYIGACAFVKKIKESKFTLENYSILLNDIYNEAYNDMEAMQDAYDTETKNGQVKDKQEAWNKKIDDLLAAL